MNISAEIRESLVSRSAQILAEINYIGLGNIEFIVNEKEIYFSEINPTFQINTLIPEVHTLSNFIKKQFAISRGEPLYQEQDLKVITPQYHVFLVSLMAEDPYNNFQPSAGEVSDFFYYSDIRTIFKTILFTGAPISPMYDPYIGKILSFSPRREESLRELRKFLDNIIIRGIRTNLIMLKQLLRNESLNQGSSFIDFINLKLEFPRPNKSDDELTNAAALLAAAFHIDNRKKNYKTELEQMKQPGLIKRLFGLLRGDV